VDYAHSDKDFEDDDGKLMKIKPVFMNLASTDRNASAKTMISRTTNNIC